MPTWKLTVEYQGTRYHGWQEQKNARTVAGEFRQAAESFFGKPVELSGAGRTDAGVHALGQVVRLHGDRQVRSDELRYSLNDALPGDINVLAVEPAQYRFDPRRDARVRYYLYQISVRRAALAKRFVWWVKDHLDLPAMVKAAALLPGRHDFRRFTEPTRDESSTVVVVERAEIGTDGDLILVRIGASHFLWKMVRRVVGVLVEIGRGAVLPEQLEALLKPASGSQRESLIEVASHTAPPSGLFLERITYGEEEPPGRLTSAIPVKRAGE